MPSATPVPETAVHDVVVVGSGVAGLVAALAAASTRGPVGPRVALVTAGALVSGCTPWAQGGLAAPLGDDDSAGLHLADTLEAGRGLCDEAAVRVLVDEAPLRVRDLVGWGVRFDRDERGTIALGREAAHSRARIVHAGGDATGLNLANALAARVASGDVEVLEGHVLTGLLDDGAGRCAGVELVEVATGARRVLLAPSTIIATGGAGRLWRRTTNPAGAVGAGIAAAWNVGAEVASLEFTQFHPTVLDLPGAPAFLISEAVRGEGAYVVDEAGRRLLLDTDPRGELAGRDVVAAALWRHLRSDPAAAVFIDARHVAGVAARFPTVTSTLRGHGLDLARDLIPIAPAAHYTIGGVRTDLDGRTTVPGLFAAGEVASTGVHGANRLASNSLLEGVVFGARAGRAAREAAAEAPRPPRELGTPATSSTSGAVGPAEEALEARLREVMDRGAGLLRDAAGLDAASAGLAAIATEAAGLDLPPTSTLRHALATASLTCQAASLRCETRGAHRRSDHPGTDAAQDGVWVLHRTRSPRCDSNARPHH